MRRLLRAVRRWHHSAHVKDCDATLAHFEAQAARLPAAIRHMRELRKFHAGRLETLRESRPVVSFSLGRGRQWH